MSTFLNKLLVRVLELPLIYRVIYVNYIKVAVNVVVNNDSLNMVKFNVRILRWPEIMRFS